MMATVKQGKLVDVKEDDLTIEEKQGKSTKAIAKKISISFNQIKHTKVLVTF